MRILKIELQNINSLKSERPIVIDFESERFKDVGLFAITGPTGAGKTTLLDAITIALYHKVPRFNNSHVKAGLEDVISYGAHNAMSRVTFLSHGVKYESFWSMSLTGRGGKRLSVPKELVRLKNLVTEKSIAEKKRELVSTIEEITHLDYNQFLRSAMLAQGEFAAFLSAKVDEKGKLLEQITGQDIYKRIGESVSDRVSKERKVLEAIRAEVNNKDVLSSEQITELETEQKALQPSLTTLDKSLEQTRIILDWYKQTENLDLQKKSFVQDEEVWKATLLKSEKHLKRLDLHEKAEQYKPNLDQVISCEKSIAAHKVKIEETDTKIKQVLPLIATLKIEHTECEKEVNSAKQTQGEWAKKLELISVLDAGIQEKNKQHNALSQERKKVDNEFEQLEKQLNQTSSDKEKQNHQFKKLEEHCKQNQFLEELETQLPEIKTSATLWKEDYLALEENKKALTKQKTVLSDSTERLLIQKREHAKKQANAQAENDKQTALSQRLQELHLNKINAQLEEIHAASRRIAEAKLLSDSFNTDTKRMSEGNELVVALSKEIDTKQKRLKQQEEERGLLNTQIADARKIVELESKVKALEDERKQLKKGEACPLCGSLEHPLVEHYGKIQLSESQALLQKREDKWNLLNQNISTLQASIAKDKGKLEQYNVGLSNLQKSIAQSAEKFTQLDFKAPLSNSAYFESEQKRLSEELKVLLKQQKQSQETQKQLSESNDLLMELTKQLSAINGTISGIQERLEHGAESLTQLEKSKGEISKRLNEHKTNLENLLSSFEWELPEIALIDNFIAQASEMIASYKKLKAEKEELEKARIKTDEQHRALKKEHTEKQELRTNKLNDLLKIQLEVNRKKEERNQILPQAISVEAKRTQLKQTVGKAEEKFHLSNQRLQQKQQEAESLKAYLITLTKESEELNKILIEAETKLANTLNKSHFSTRHELSSALISREEKQGIEQQKKQLNEAKIRLKTIASDLQKRETELANNKHFSESNEGAQALRSNLESERNSILKRIGEIQKQFEIDHEIKTRNKAVFDKVEAQEKELKKWKDLLQLLGGSKDAFNRYVQRLTLQNLVQLANLHLYKLNPRYSLKMSETYKTGEELNFALVDHYQTNRVRPVDTSSGGEKFLISLSLALGLSDLASNNVKIESLFIDEGFGTLDTATLEVVLSALEALQAQGKMIGVISHVENMKERIPAQIQVTKKASGISEVSIV